MPTVKHFSTLFIRLLFASMVMSLAYILSTFVISQPRTPMTPEEASWAGKAVFMVSAINALVLAYPILRSRWHGLKLICVVFLTQFGVETFLAQIESLYFNSALQLTENELAGLFLAGAIRALIFSPLAVCSWAG